MNVIITVYKNHNVSNKQDDLYQLFRVMIGQAGKTKFGNNSKNQNYKLGFKPLFTIRL